MCVIYEGMMVYYGPRHKARQYLIEMGYEPANKQTTADFIVAGAFDVLFLLTSLTIC